MEPMARPSRYSPEIRERAVRMVREHGAEHPSQWAAIASIAAKLGCTTETLRRWVRQAERDAGQRAGLTTDERSDGGIHRPASGWVWGRADLPGLADRPVDVLSAQGAARGSGSALGACTSGRRAETRHSTHLDRAFPGVWAAQGVAADGPRRSPRGALSRTPVDARDGARRCGARTRLDDHDAVAA